MNPFEVRQNKSRRRSVLTTKRSRGCDSYGSSRQTTLSKTKRSLALLLDLQRETKKRSFVDNRLKSKHGALLTDSQSAALRLRTLRVSKARKVAREAFNLSDEADTMEGDTQPRGTGAKPNTPSEDLVMTHQGKPIEQLNDYILADTNVFEENRDDESDQDFVPATTHFGQGMSNRGETSNGVSAKTRKFIYEEILEKSKQAKAERVRQKISQDESLGQLDTQFQDIRKLLSFNVVPRPHDEPTVPLHNLCDNSTDYSNLLKQLTLEARCQPTDRVKTEAELAADRVALFNKLENERLKATKESESTSCDSDSHDTITDTDEESDAEEGDESEFDEEDEKDESELDEEQDIHDKLNMTNNAKSFNMTIDKGNNGEDGKDGHHFQCSDTANSAINNTRFTPKKHDQDTHTKPYSQDNVDKQDRDKKKKAYVSSPTQSTTHSPLRSTVDAVQELKCREILLHQKYLHNLRSRSDIFFNTACEEDEKGVPHFVCNAPNDWERDLPFHCDVPQTYENFKELMDKYIPSAQYKLIYRMRTRCDPLLTPENHAKLENLLEYLICYVWEGIVEQFETGHVGYLTKNAQKLSPNHLPESHHIDAVASLIILKTCIGELANAYPRRFMQFFTLHLAQACLVICPDLLEKIQRLPHYSALEPTISPRPSAKSQTPLASETLATLHLLFSLYPTSQQQNILVNMAAMLLDTLGQYASSLYQYDAHDMSQEDSHDGFPSCFRLAKDCSVAHSTILLGLMVQFLSGDSPHYIPSFFPLACAILNTIFQDGDMLSQQIVRDTCDHISYVIRVWSASTGSAPMDLLFSRILIPTTSRILSIAPALSCVQQLNTLCQHYLNRPAHPVHFGKVAPEGIKMLLPKYVNATSAAGSRYLRANGASEEALELKKLKRAVKSERRGASRQLRRDAEVLAAIRAREKQKQDAKRSKNFKNTMATLEKDAQELHRMRTSVVPQGKTRYRPKKR